jgi:hypothetical protein
MATTARAGEHSSSRSPRKCSNEAASPLVELLSTARELAAAKKGGERPERLDRRSKVNHS